MARPDTRQPVICRGGPLNHQGWWRDDLEARNAAAEAVRTPHDPSYAPGQVLYRVTGRREQIEFGKAWREALVAVPDHELPQAPAPEHTPEVDADLARVDETHVYVAAMARPTSVKAAAAVYPRTGTQRRRVLDAITDATRRGHGGATDPEIQRHLDMGPNTERPRRLELVEQGFVADSGRVRVHDGRDHIVWCATLLAMNTSVDRARERP